MHRSTWSRWSTTHLYALAFCSRLTSLQWAGYASDENRCVRWQGRWYVTELFTLKLAGSRNRMLRSATVCSIASGETSQVMKRITWKVMYWQHLVPGSVRSWLHASSFSHWHPQEQNERRPTFRRTLRTKTIRQNPRKVTSYLNEVNPRRKRVWNE